MPFSKGPTYTLEREGLKDNNIQGASSQSPGKLRHETFRLQGAMFSEESNPHID